MAFLRARLGHDTVLFDLAAQDLHLLNPSATWLAEVGDTPVQDLVASVVEEFGTSTSECEAEIRAGLDALRSVGIAPGSLHSEKHTALVPVTRAPVGPAEPGFIRGRPHRVLDQTIVFRSPSADLLADIDALLGSNPNGDPDAPASLDSGCDTAEVCFDVVPTQDGRIELHADDEWDFPNRRTLLAQLPGVIHDHAARHCGFIVFHAGAVRTSSGEVLMIPGHSTAGKSTLTAALVMAGCDLISEEMTAVTAGSLQAIGYGSPFKLDERSRAALGLAASSDPLTHLTELRDDARALVGPVGPIGRIVLPRFEAETSLATRRHSPIEALMVLLPHALNLIRAGDPGLQTVCDLAERVAVIDIGHSDAVELAKRIVMDEI